MGCPSLLHLKIFISSHMKKKKKDSMSNLLKRYIVNFRDVSDIRNPRAALEICPFANVRVYIWNDNNCNITLGLLFNSTLSRWCTSPQMLCGCSKHTYHIDKASQSVLSGIKQRHCGFHRQTNIISTYSHTGVTRTSL